MIPESNAITSSGAQPKKKEKSICSKAGGENWLYWLY